MFFLMYQTLYQGMLQAPTPSLSHKLTLPGNALSSHVIPQPQAHSTRECSELPCHPSATSSLHQGDTRRCSKLPRHPSATSSLYQEMLQAPTSSLSHKLTLPGNAPSSHGIPQPQAHSTRGCSELPRHPSATSSLYQGML